MEILLVTSMGFSRTLLQNSWTFQPFLLYHFWNDLVLSKLGKEWEAVCIFSFYQFYNFEDSPRTFWQLWGTFLFLCSFSIFVFELCFLVCCWSKASLPPSRYVSFCKCFSVTDSSAINQQHSCSYTNGHMRTPFIEENVKLVKYTEALLKVLPVGIKYSPLINPRSKALGD